MNSAPSPRLGGVAFALTILGWMGVSDPCAGEDAVIAAARASLADGQAGQAMTLLEGHPDLAKATVARVLMARSYLMRGDPKGALVLLEAERKGTDPSLWPEDLRGAVRQLVGECWIVADEPEEGVRWLRAALAGGGADEGRCRLLLGEAALAARDARAVIHLVTPLWNRVPRRGDAAAAGLLLARAQALVDPQAARAVLAEIRALPGLSVPDRAAAVDLLCAILLPIAPGECLVVSEREAAAGTAGTVRLWRALALAALDPRDGLAALRKLPADERSDVRVQDAEARCQQAVTTGQEADGAARLMRAQAMADLDRWDDIATILGSLPATDPRALRLVLGGSRPDPRPWLQAQAGKDPVGALALGRALVLAGMEAEAWRILKPLVGARSGSIDQGEVLHWAKAAANQAAPELVGGLRGSLLVLEGPDWALGQAWAEEAQARALAGLPAGEAWATAAEQLPLGHPWLAASAAEAGRFFLADQRELARAAAILRRLEGAPVTEDLQRCRFLLVQIEARRGDLPAAQAAAQSLVPYAGRDQLQRLKPYLEEGNPGAGDTGGEGSERR